MDGSEYDVLYNLLLHGTYPEGLSKNKKDALRSKGKKFTVDSGLLIYSCDEKRGLQQVCHSAAVTPYSFLTNSIIMLIVIDYYL